MFRQYNSLKLKTKIMTLELLVFIASVLFGVLIYWRESHSNRIYRFFNKLMYSKKLQMKPEDKTGFVFQQSFLLRLVFITLLFLILIVLVRFLIPIDLATISIFVSSIVGTLIGTYAAGFFKKYQSGMATLEIKEERVEELPHQTVNNTAEELQEKAPETEEKSARDRLKEKGLL